MKINSDPMEVTKYLFPYDPPGIDFLMPDYNLDFRPLKKENDSATPYVDWLIRPSDFWFNEETNTRVRFFESIIRQTVGCSSLIESLGLEPAKLIVGECKGDVEGLDVLKTSFRGAGKLGYNVFDHDFELVPKHPSVTVKQRGLRWTLSNMPKMSYSKTVWRWLFPTPVFEVKRLR